MPRIRLYHYWRSSASWRVRWAFALKKIECEFVAVDLLGDEPESPEHRARNPLGYVPVLEFLDGPHRYLSQSMAIIDWAEAVTPLPALFASDTFERAYQIQLCEIINADTAPLQNLPPQFMYSDDSEKRKLWAQTWIRKGLSAYQALAQKTAGTFSMGDIVSAPDLFLIPQLYNARRYEVALEEFPLLKQIYEASLATPECLAASPERYQPS